VGTASSGEPIIFDPSSFYGHNEAEYVYLPSFQVLETGLLVISLAISRMFGGFPSSFFTDYHTHKPKCEPVDEYDQRIMLYELYHYLNHTVLFGSGYSEPTSKRMKSLLKYVEGK
jgi:protein-ribulosamine 3-kinase